MQIEVIVPTVAGREQYLKWCLRSCLESALPVRVLVSNNGSGESVREVVRSFHAEQIRLVEPPSYLPMSLHWEFAVEQARGDVLTIIGDDDALLPLAAQRVADVFAEYPVVECITHRPAVYYWPDFPVASMRNRYVRPPISRNVQLTATKPALKRVLEFRAWYGTLPFLYHGFVRRRALDRIKTVHGPLFRRVAPDIYSDLVLATFLDEYLILDDCLSIGGQGAKSFGANFRLDREMADQALAELPDVLRPKFSAKSVHLELYEYGSMLREFLPKDFSLSPNWFRFTALTLAEAIRAPHYASEVLADLRKLIREAYPRRARLWALPLVRLCETPGLRQLFEAWMKGREARRVDTWARAEPALGIDNVFALATLLAAEANRAEP